MHVLLAHGRQVDSRAKQRRLIGARKDAIDDGGHANQGIGQKRWASCWPIGISRMAHETVAASRV